MLADVIALYRAAGFDLVVVETAGIGQSDTEIVDLADLSLYVMTPEFGAASQLEKIDMLDFADFIAINKFDRKGAEDAMRDVRKQYQRNRQLFAQKPDEMPVFGTQASGFGQYVYIDTFKSIYGPGWKHDAAKALHRPNGAFCYSFVPQYTPAGYPVHELRGPGLGERHRIRASGPGVTPIVEWGGPRLGPYDPVQDAQINGIFDQVLAGDRVCAKER